MKKIDIKKQEEFVELRNWINKKELCPKGLASISVRDKIIDANWISKTSSSSCQDDLHEALNSNSKLIRFFKTIQKTVYLFIYKDLEDGKIDSELSKGLLNEAVTMLINNYPNRLNGKIIGGENNFSFLLYRQDLNTWKLIACPPVAFLNLKNPEEFKKVSDWIIKYQFYQNGSVSIVKNRILSPKWGSQFYSENTSLKEFFKTYKKHVFFFYYKDLENDNTEINSESDVLKNAALKLVHSYPYNKSGKIWGNIKNYSFLLSMESKDCQRLIAFPPATLNEYGQYTYWDEQDKVNRWDFTKCLYFFVDNIQQYRVCFIDGEGTPTIRKYEGLPVDTFLNKYKGKEEEKFIEIFNWIGHLYNPESIIEEQCDLVQLQSRLESEGKQVSFGNIILLAEFIKEKCESRYLALLEPTFEEIYKLIEKRGGVSRVVVQCGNGDDVICERPYQIDFFKDAIKNKINSKKRIIKVKEIVKWTKLVDKTIIQALFVHDMIQFLNKFFPGKRKKDSLISTSEQELICWVMYHVGLTETKVSNSRFKQLYLLFDKTNIDRNADLHILPNSFQNRTGHSIVALDFLSWEQWHENKIDWSQPIERYELQVGDVLDFKDTKID